MYLVLQVLDKYCMLREERVGIWQVLCICFVKRELKQTRGRRKMWHRVSAIIFQLFKLIMFEKCVLSIMELNWNQRLGHEKTNLNICHHILTSSTQLQNRSFHVVERTRTSIKCQKWKMQRAKNTVFRCQIGKFVRFLLRSSSWLLKLRNNWGTLLHGIKLRMMPKWSCKGLNCMFSDSLSLTSPSFQRKANISYSKHSFT